MLEGLERRRRKDEDYSAALKSLMSEMNEMMEISFVRKLSKTEIDEYQGPVYYIPHYSVIRLEKRFVLLLE